MTGRSSRPCVEFDGAGIELVGLEFRVSKGRLTRGERTDRDVVSVRIPEQELLCLSVWIHMRLLLVPSDESERSLQSYLKIAEADEQK